MWDWFSHKPCRRLCLCAPFYRKGSFFGLFFVDETVTAVNSRLYSLITLGSHLFHQQKIDQIWTLPIKWGTKHRCLQGLRENQLWLSGHPVMIIMRSLKIYDFRFQMRYEIEKLNKYKKNTSNKNIVTYGRPCI